ncbi:MAG: bifunctional diguanylate cyclase/phosphodiesterase, partial [Nocardioides sp.]|uniref:EAL domain-containing protein n=1 Tax=Nocardioides sp. TaxID=35761 RepID=UPI0039E61284
PAGRGRRRSRPAHALLERLRPGSRGLAFGRRPLLLACAGVAAAIALVAVDQRLANAHVSPWPAIATAAAVGLATLAAAQFARIAMLSRVNDALTEASSSTPWPPEAIDDTLIHLVSGHVRAARISVEAAPGGPEALSEEIHPGSVLVLRREPGDFGFGRHDARLVAALAAMARASHSQAARESRLWAAAVTDELTGLWEYEQWRSHLRELSLTRGGREKLGIVFLDLDHFKQVNSDYGHLRADQLLTAIGGRLLRQSPQWRFGRFGGDEFVGVARNIRDEAHLDELCRGLAAIIRQPVETDGAIIAATASVGRVLSPNRGDSPDVVLAKAEHDLRERKAAREVGAGQPVARVDENDVLLRVLDHGVDVAYQPIIDVATREVVGWEALLRGHLPLLGSLNPEELVDSAVRAGVLDVITRQVAQQAIATSTRVAERVQRRLTLSLNLEQEQFRSNSSLIKWVIEQSAHAPIDLVLELTERGAPDTWGSTEDALADELIGRGIGLALDDLGAGNARMAMLARRHWHTVKLDRAFLTSGARGLVLLGHAVTMLHDLGLTIVMEGVETAEQLAIVERLGIDQVQGHYFAAAGTAEELLSFVERRGLGFSPASI